jgi:GGDEF domain-containing protein
MVILRDLRDDQDAAPEAIAGRVFDLVRRWAPGSGGGICLASGENWVLSHQAHLKKAFVDSICQDGPQAVWSLLGTKSIEPTFVPLSKDHPCRRVVEVNAETLAAVPFFSRGAMHGGLFLLTPKPLPRETQAAMELLGLVLGLWLEEAGAGRGVPEGSFREGMRREVKRALRYKRPLSLLFVRLEGLAETSAAEQKEAVKRFTQLMSRNTREYDSHTQLEEGLFAVVLPETDQKTAKRFGEKIQRLCREDGALKQCFLRDVALRFGVATLPDDAATSVSLLRKARATLDHS